MDDELLTTEDAAGYYGLKPTTLEQWRWEGKGPAFIRLSKRAIRYRRSDLDEHINANVVSAGEAA